MFFTDVNINDRACLTDRVKRRATLKQSNIDNTNMM